MTDAQVRILTLIEKGRHFYQSGEWLEAQRCWQEVLRIDPRHPHALFLLQQLPYTHHASGHYPSASHEQTDPHQISGDYPSHVQQAAQRAAQHANHYASVDTHNTEPDLDALFNPSDEVKKTSQQTSASHAHIQRADFGVSEEDDQFFDDSFLSAPPSSFVARIAQLTDDPTPPLGHTKPWRQEEEGDESFLKPPPSSDYARYLFDDLAPNRLPDTSTSPSPRASRDLLSAWDPSLAETDSSPHYPSYKNHEPAPLEWSSPAEPHTELWGPTPSAPSDERDMLFAAAEDLYQSEDFEGALEMLDILKNSGPLSEIAQRLGERCRHFLQKEYVSHFADATQTPRLNVPIQQLGSLELDHRAGFLLSQIDGRTNLKDLLLLSNLAEFDFLRIIHQLMQKGVIAL